MYSVVGVARDVKQMGPQKEAPLAIYVPYSQAPRDFFLSFMTIVARTDSDPLSMANTLRRAVQTVDPDMPLFDVASMEQLVYKSVASARFNALLLACFAALARDWHPDGARGAAGRCPEAGRQPRTQVDPDWRCSWDLGRAGSDALLVKPAL